MTLYTKEELRNIFQHPFSQESWKAILRNCFHVDMLRTKAESFSAPEDREKGYYMGAKETSDNYRIGLFYYIIETGSVAHKKVGLRNLVKRFVNANWGEFDAAIVVFDDKNEWRLSFVCDIKEEATAPKRFTFVFGEHDNLYRTAIDRFIELQSKGPSFENIRKAFSVEELSDEFFDEYRNRYADFVQFITGKRYVKERGKWVERKLGKPDSQYFDTFEGDDKLVRDYIKKMFGRIVFLYFLQRKGWLADNRQYMHDLYYQSEKKDTFLDDVLEPLFFDILNEKPQNRSAIALSLPGSDRIPYLNGGLFAKDEIDDRPCVFPQSLFKSLLDFLDSYNFTIDENDRDDAEIGIDPEMLGRIFENLLEDNKDKGAFYTPKDIVDYMCRESIIAYLTGTLPDIPNDSIRQLTEHLDPSSLSDKDLLEIRRKLQSLKICDPAIGSGAFPMGLVNLLSKLYIAMNPDTDRAKMKRHIMEQNIYGVDIEKGAIDIARLLFWLAMIVEESEAIPLPNLHFKIMQGNSLLESYQGVDLSDMTKVKPKQNTYENILDKKVTDGSFWDSDSTERETLVADLRSYYKTSDHAERDRLFTEIIRNVRRQLHAKNIILPNGMDPSANEDFFLWHTWFSDVFVNGGFDIVIGNPPYISAPAQVANPVLNELRKNIIKTNKYESLYQKWDLYIAFVELGLRMLKSDGIETMIIPYPYTNQGYAMKSRQMILDKYKLHEISDLKEIKVFKNATVQNCILFVEKNKRSENVRVSHSMEDSRNKSIKLIVDYEKNKNSLIQNAKGVWDLKEEKNRQELHPDFHVLGDFCYISVGMVLNADEKTAQGTFKKDDLISETQDGIHSRKYIEAKDIQQYRIKRFRFLEWNTHRCPDKLRRPTFRELYEVPKLLINRLGDLQSTTDLDIHFLHNDSIFCAVPWFELADIFNKSITNSIKRYSTLSRSEMERLSQEVSLKYLCAILNSSYGKVLLQEQRGGDYHIYPDHIRNIPIPIASEKTQKSIGKLVDEVITITDKKSDKAIEKLSLIDILVYKAYDLSFNDILSHNPGFNLTQEEYESFQFKDAEA